MTGAFPHLFSPLQLRGRELRNRIVSTPHATGWGRDGLIDPREADYHIRKAAGGAALVMTFGSASVYPTTAASYGSTRSPPRREARRSSLEPAGVASCVCLRLGVVLRHKTRQAECGPGAGGAGDRRQEFRAAGRAVGGRSRGHRPTAVRPLCSDQEVNPALNLGLTGRKTGQRQSVQRLAGGECVALQFRRRLAPAAVGAWQDQ